MRTGSLEDKYTVEDGRVFLSGAQAVVRLALDQARLDRRAGRRTAGFVSGYRGSPLGGVDTAFWGAAEHLRRHDVHFEPGLNEEIAATAVAGSQHAALFGSRYEGVFGLFYAKNPGIDRAADALKHANADGTAALGGVLAIAGDDPAASSSSLPNQCEQAFIAALIPVLYPASLEEVLSFGLAGIALSRYAGVWVGLKAVADTIESTGSLTVTSSRRPFAVPADYELPPGGLNTRWPDERWPQDERLLRFRLPAVRAFARANGLDRVVLGGPQRRLAVVAAGRAMAVVRAALDALGLDEARSAALGVVVYKVGLVWPLEPEGIGRAVAGLADVLVVEERRAVIEPQLKELAFNWPAAQRPTIVGKHDESGRELIAEAGELAATPVALAIGARLARLGALPADVGARLRALAERHAADAAGAALAPRVANFCAGCPHAQSTRVPEGSIALGGIGCHSLRLWMPDNRTLLLPQMGGEGANWIGIAPFTDLPHVFQNLGDGTYAHSGSLSIRAAVAAGRRITFRVLFNGATAMTGGQPPEGALTVAKIVGQLAAEGVRRIAVVASEPDRHRALPLGAGVSVHAREELAAVERALREEPGVTALVFDQLCATEARRARKRAPPPVAAERPVINTRVCEGCGDCVTASECAAIVPVETPFGVKRQVDQSNCNTDYACIAGFCPSFVTLTGARPRRHDAAPPAEPLPPPPSADGAAQIVIAGIGGTGVMTVGAVAGMAAHLAGLACAVLDDTGMARKGGAVTSHIHIARGDGDVIGARVHERRASLVLACDLVSACGRQVLATIDPGRTRIVGNANVVPTLAQRLAPESEPDGAIARQTLERAAGDGCCEWLPAAAIAQRALGDTVYANLVMFGYAWQRGWVPLPLAAIDDALALNGGGVAANRQAFAWGRRAAVDPAAVTALLGGAAHERTAATLAGLVAERAAYLAEYQDERYAERYRALVGRAREAEQRAAPGSERLATAVARGYFRLLAAKDEYEVARLYSDGEFARALADQFEGDYRVRYHLALPLARLLPGRRRGEKRSFGAWIVPAFRLLARLRRVRGTWLDPFRLSAERRLERALVRDYESTLAELLTDLSPATLERATAVALAFERIRGYGRVKARFAAEVRGEVAGLLDGARAAAQQGRPD